ncbi:hypothetical protein CUC50_23985 [Citrobacter werkmanii]|nr:hypothetical protein CUC50_23985 [Citrobacter werkmanii]
MQVCWLRSLTRITYSSKLIGFIHLPRYSTCGLAPSGPAQALFKMLLAFCPATRMISGGCQ